MAEPVIEWRRSVYSSDDCEMVDIVVDGKIRGYAYDDECDDPRFCGTLYPTDHFYADTLGEIMTRMEQQVKSEGVKGE